jgi:hypothetical protein
MEISGTTISHNRFHRMWGDLANSDRQVCTGLTTAREIMNSEEMLSMSGTTAAPDALGSVQRSGLQVVAVDSPTATLGLISVEALTREIGSGQIADLVDAASIVIRQEAIPLVSPTWLRAVGVIRVAADLPPPAPICPVDHTICRCDGVCLKI